MAAAARWLADDLAVVPWNGPFVSEPSGVEDVPDLLELATVQLLELRYEALLDPELSHSRSSTLSVTNSADRPDGGRRAAAAIFTAGPFFRVIRGSGC